MIYIANVRYFQSAKKWMELPITEFFVSDAINYYNIHRVVFSHKSMWFCEW